MKIICLMLISLCLSACFQTKTVFNSTSELNYASLDTSDNVFIYTALDSLIPGRIKIGSFDHFQPMGLALSKMLEKIKTEARSHGANIIKIKYYYIDHSK